MADSPDASADCRRWAFGLRGVERGLQVGLALPRGLFERGQRRRMPILEHLLQHDPLGLIVGRELGERRVALRGKPLLGGLAFGGERGLERRAIGRELRR